MRKAALLRKRYVCILSSVCELLCLFGVIMLMPLLLCVMWGVDRSDCAPFAVPGGLLVAVGALGWYRLGRNVRQELTLLDGGVIVLLAWLCASVAGAFPFMISSVRLPFSHAIFESVSGLTTTGLTLVDVTTASHAVLMWRSILQLVGGAGLAIMMMAALVGPSSPVVSASEGRADQLVPHVRKSARLVLALYSGYVLIGIAGYSMAGLTLFDAITHTFTAVATGGFSTHPESIGHWDSPFVEGVTIVLMILGNFNFVTAWLLVRGRAGAFVKNAEIRVLAFLIATGAGLLFVSVTATAYSAPGKALRTAVFECVSALTGTGFTSTTYSGWPPLGFLVLIILMLVGGGTCSTSGALKQFRVYVLMKAVYWEVRRSLLPQRTVLPKVVWEGEEKGEVSDARLHAIAAYSFLYLATWVLGALILAMHGYGVKESLFEYASALGTVGLSLGITTPDAPLGVIWTETAGMFLGRLEFFVVFISLVKLTRDTMRMLRK